MSVQLFSRAFVTGLACAALACGIAAGGSPEQIDAAVHDTDEAVDDRDQAVDDRDQAGREDVPVLDDPAAASAGGVPDSGLFGCGQGRLEACNGLDDDCDGSLDEGFDADGDGRLSRPAGCAAFYPDAELDCDDRFAELGARCPIFVRAGVRGSNSGADWDNAFNDLHAALAVAQTGDEIRVAAGTYTADRGTLDRLQSFVVPPGVWLRGSYDGISYDGRANDRALHPTILSGDLLADDLLATGGREDNSRHVVQTITRPLSPGKIVIEGVVIRGGHAEGYSRPEDGKGGALYGQSPLLEIRDCLITDSDGIGGAVYFEGETLLMDRLELLGNRAGNRGSVLQANAATTLTRSVVRDNHSPYGVAVVSVASYGELSTSPVVVIADTRFIDNSSGWENGSALALFATGNIQIEDCEFANNRGGHGGAAIVQAPMIAVRRSVFRDNTASTGFGGSSQGYGGALALLASDYFETEVSIDDCRFEGNRAAYGGALYTLGPGFTMRSTTFVDNEATIAGGAIGAGNGTTAAVSNSEFRSNRAGGLGGAWAVTTDAQVSCSQCVFNANSVKDGQGTLEGLPNDMEASALWIDSRASVRVASSAFVNHGFTEAAPDSDTEGLIAVSSGTFAAVNTVFWGNALNQLSVRINGKEPASASFSYCAADLTLAGVGTFLLSASPFNSVLGPDGLAGTLDDDLRLHASSACIDAGDSSGFVSHVAQDFQGQTRFVDAPDIADVGVGGTPSIDIGPFEYQGI